MALVVKTPLEYWQSLIWDPAVTDNTFYEFCDALTQTNGTFGAVANLPFNHTERLVKVSDELSVDFIIVNYANWIKEARFPIYIPFSYLTIYFCPNRM